MLPNISALPGLLIALAMTPICAFAIITIIHWMMENQLDVGAGLGAIVLVILVCLVTILSKSQLVAGVVMIVMINLIVFLPYGIEQAAKADLQGADIDRLDRIHKEISERPENVSSYFAIADLVHELGLPGHAVMIVESTLQRLSTEMDPVKNQSIRDVFRAEESRAKEWRRHLKDSSAYRAVACPRCGHRNEPGTIACAKCRGPFLLDLARRMDPRTKIRSRLVFGWAVVAGFFTGTVYVWSITEASIRWVVLFGGLALIAATFVWLFRPRRLGRF